MATKIEKELKKEILFLRQQKAKDDHKIRQLEQQKMQTEEKLEKHKYVHLKRLEQIHKRRGFNVADYEKKIEESEQNNGNQPTSTKIEDLQSIIDYQGKKLLSFELRLNTKDDIITQLHENAKVDKQMFQQKIDELQSKNAELNQKISDCDSERHGLISIAADLTTKNNDLIQTIKEQESKCNELQSKIDEQKKKLINYEIQLKTKDDTITELQTKNAEMEQKYFDYQIERNALISTAGVLTRRNDNLNETVTEQATIIEEFQSAIDLDKTRHEIQLKIKDDTIAELQNKLKNVKNDREILKQKIDICLSNWNMVFSKKFK